MGRKGRARVTVLISGHRLVGLTYWWATLASWAATVQDVEGVVGQEAPVLAMHRDQAFVSTVVVFRSIDRSGRNRRRNRCLFDSRMPGPAGTRSVAVELQDGLGRKRHNE